jgi:hypothetical protein
MKCPRFAVVSIALDTERYKSLPPPLEDGRTYLLNRLLSGETVADGELEHYGIKVSIRPAVKNEIAK